jgi:hypothetical protein
LFSDLGCIGCGKGTLIDAEPRGKHPDSREQPTGWAQAGREFAICQLPLLLIMGAWPTALPRRVVRLPRAITGHRAMGIASVSSQLLAHLHALYPSLLILRKWGTATASRGRQKSPCRFLQQAAGWSSPRFWGRCNATPLWAMARVLRWFSFPLLLFAPPACVACAALICLVQV